MRTIIENVIRSGRYALADILTKIDTLWVQGDLADDDRAELITLAQNNAKPENSYAPLQDQIEQAFAQIKSLQQTVEANAKGVAALKTAVEGLGGTVTEPTPEPAEEWPDYVQPTGSHDAYNTGDKITFNGEHYICKMDGCVWSPADYPTGWVKQ